MLKLAKAPSIATLCLAVAGFAPLGAQEGHESSRLRPVEIRGCMFQEGQDKAAFHEAVAKWSAWMDANGQHAYSAHVMWPLYRSKDHEADFLWMGGWPSGAEMAEGLERRATVGGEISAEFDRVVTCPYSASFAASYLSEPLRDPIGPVRFANCEIEEGRSVDEALDAISKWTASEQENGVDSQHFLLFPAYGESRDAGYVFKWVTTSTWSEFGDGFDHFANGGGMQESSELFGELLNCDTPRVYVSSKMRGSEQRRTP